MSDISTIQEWMREPDNVEEFSLAEVIEWLNRRPIAEVTRLAATPMPYPAAQAKGISGNTAADLREVAEVWEQSAVYCDNSHLPELAARDRRLAAAMRTGADILSTPASEPVAWRWRYNTQYNWEYGDSCNAPSKVIYEIESLYAAPAQCTFDNTREPK